MGSSGSRVAKGAVIVKPPQKKTPGSTGTGGSGGQGGNNQKQLTCPVTLRFDLPKDLTLKIGTKVKLVLEKDMLTLYAGIIKIGTLSKSRSQQISACIELGFKYPGLVKAEAGGGTYVEFRKTT